MDSGGDDTSQTPSVGRIPENVARGTVIFLYVLAMIAALLRSAIRLRYDKLQWLDDGFLLTAVVMMTVSFGIYFSFISDVFITELFIYDPFAAGPLLVQAVQIGEHVQTFTIPYIIISISGIFAVKFSFLFFFRNILSRIQPLVIFWRCVVGFTAVAWAFSVGFSVFGCPYVDDRALSCAQGSELWKAIDASVALIVFDISSDILIVLIPLLILHRIRLPWKKKIYLAASLCVSLVMVTVAILQAATLTYAGVAAIDVVWQIYFQIVELTLAVIVVSSTAFRAFFVQRNTTQGSDSTPKTPQWYRYRTYKKVWHKIWSSSSEESEPPTVNAEIPGGTMTGMRTYIDRAAGSPWPDSSGARETVGQRETEMRQLRSPPAARVEPAGFTESMISPEEEYHRIQRNILTRAPASLGSPRESDEEIHAAQPTSISDLNSNDESTRVDEASLPSGGRQRSSIVPSEHTSARIVTVGDFPAPEPHVSPIDNSSLQDYSIRASWKPSAEPSAMNSRRHSRPEPSTADRPLPPTPPRKEASQLEEIHEGRRSSQLSREASQTPASASTARRPSRSLRPQGEEPLRESGIKRAIKDSFDMASDIRHQDENWLYDG